MIRTGLIGSAICILAMAGIWFWSAQTLPVGEQIPVHWNAEGVADGFGTKRDALIGLAILPLTALLMAPILAAAPCLDPRRKNLLKGSKLYLIVWLGTMILFTGLTGLIAYSMQPNFSASSEMGDWMLRAPHVGISTLMIVMGNYLPKTRSNFFLGIRTPWTLSSEISWEKTHRLGGKLFIAAGVIGLLGALFGQAYWQKLIVAPAVMIAVVIVLPYSWCVWKDASDRHGDGDYL